MKNRKVLILVNHFITLYAFRLELVEQLLSTGHQVYIALPLSAEAELFAKMGCHVIDTSLERRGTNPFSDIKLLFRYVWIMQKIKPDIILTYTIKPNIYGGLASVLYKIPIIHTVTGLGSVYIQNIWQKKIIILLNRLAFQAASLVVFLNKDNEQFYLSNQIISKHTNTMGIPGSGVNLDKFLFSPLPDNNRIVFTFVGRILKDKGIEEYLAASEKLVAKYNHVEFQVVGFVDEKKYVDLLKEYESRGYIKYLGKRDDIPAIMAQSTCIVLPSYGEGRGTVLQEGAAVGRPLITCDTYGCKETVVDGVNGYLCRVADANSLADVIEKFINLHYCDKALMGAKSREKAVKEFDRQNVVQSYQNAINQLSERRL